MRRAQDHAQVPAIGGEMEGAGIWAASARNDTPWILVKGVCDWADGKKGKEYQEFAAAAAVSLCLHVLQDERALDGIPESRPLRLREFLRNDARERATSTNLPKRERKAERLAQRNGSTR